MTSVAEGAFREALSRFASGVVIVTTHGSERPVGFTASAFSSVSLEPPLILVCVAKTASAFDAITAAEAFGVSVLGRQQAWIASQFARQGIDRFEGVALRPGSRVPLIEGALAQLDCKRHAHHDAGDHTIVVGEVLLSHLGAGEPLVHFGRKFGAFSGLD